MKNPSAILLAATLLSSSDALTPSSSTGRRAFLSKVAAGSVATATTVAAVTTTAPAAFAAADYDLGGIDDVATKKDTPKKSGDGGAIVGGALAAGFALSLPFFAPNLARMAGIKNAKQPKN